MSIGSLSKRVARLNGDASTFDQYIATLQDGDLDAISNAHMHGTFESLGADLRAKWARLQQLDKAEREPAGGN